MPAKVQQPENSTPVAAAAPPPRRPRVREVSSRFMSPVVTPSSSSMTSSSSSDLHHPRTRSPLPATSLRRSNSVQRQRHGSPEKNRLEGVSRSSESPMGGAHCRPVAGQPRPRSVLRLFNDSVDGKVPHSSGMCNGSSKESSIDSDEESTKENSDKHTTQRCEMRSPRQLRSSISNTDMVPTISGRLRMERSPSKGRSFTSNDDSLKFSTPSFSRSLNSPFLSHDKIASQLVKSSNASKMGSSLCLPPMPPCASKQVGTDAKKVVKNKVSSHQEDVHRLKLLHNRYLQWRYVNAKAEASMIAQKRENERQLYSLAVQISELRDSVTRKRVEHGLLKRIKALTAILDAQIPNLEEWSALNEDYSCSLMGLTQGLLSVSSQLPIIENVRCDIGEVSQAMNLAVKTMEMIFMQVENFMPKTEQLESLISELAKVCGGERALVEESGDLLSKTYISQVEECSLRGQFMQLHRGNLVPIDSK